MRKAIASMLLSLMLATGPMMMPVFAAVSSHSNVEPTYPLVGGLAGGAGLLVVLIGMSKTKRRATHADDNIDLEKSVITHRVDKYIRTDKRKKNKK